MNNDKLARAIKNVEGSSKETCVGFYESKEDFAMTWALEGMKIMNIQHTQSIDYEIKKLSRQLFDEFIFDEETGAVFAPF